MRNASIEPALPYLALAGGVLIVSTASILIRCAQAGGMPSLSIAAGRLGIAALLLAPLAWLRRRDELLALTPRDLALGMLSGVFLAAHFALWITSLAYTSVASSVALVTTNPLWVGIASMLLLRERPGAGTLAGIALTLAGSALIFISDGGAEADLRQSDPLLGNALALVGAFSASGYLLAGRSLRGRVSVLGYVWVSYTTAAALLLFAVALLDQRVLGFSASDYLLVVALAVGPQLLGHTAFNWALKYVSATFVAVSILGEPIGSSLLAFWMFGEGFAPLQLAGFLLLLAGIYGAAVSERRNAVRAPSAG